MSDELTRRMPDWRVRMISDREEASDGALAGISGGRDRSSGLRALHKVGGQCGI